MQRRGTRAVAALSIAPILAVGGCRAGGGARARSEIRKACRLWHDEKEHTDAENVTRYTELARLAQHAANLDGSWTQFRADADVWLAGAKLRLARKVPDRAQLDREAEAAPRIADACIGVP